jgi:DNA-binding MarR family transcriptional regulator
MGPICNCLALRQAARRVTQLYDQALSPVGLRATQYSLLVQIEVLGPIALNPLAEVMVMDRATLGHNVRPLEARRLVRLAVGEDRRSREVSVTQEGHALITKGRKLWRKAQRSFDEEIGRGPATTLRMALHRVAAAEFMRT